MASEGFDDWLSTVDFSQDLQIPDLDLSQFVDLHCDLDIAVFPPIDVSFSSLSQQCGNASVPSPPTVENASFSSHSSVKNVLETPSSIESFPIASSLSEDVNFTLPEDATSPDSCSTQTSTVLASSVPLTAGHSPHCKIGFCKAITSESPEKVRNRSVCLESTQGEGQRKVFDDKAELNTEDKKQQRLLRNRELAYESRERKKSYIHSLEAKCKLLEKERNDLMQRVCLTSSENAVLKEELSRLKKMKGYTGATEPAVLFEDSLPLEFLLLLLCQFLLLIWVSLSVHPSLGSFPRTFLLLKFSIKREAGKLRNDQPQTIRSEYCITYLKLIQFDDCG